MSNGSATMSSPPIEQLQGVVERLTFHSEESGYTVARLKAPRTRELITIVGSFANIQAGQTLQLQGIWRDHPKYGPQFQVKQYKETKPATLTGIEKYLGSGLIKGVGPVTAKRIVAHFGLDTLDIIEHHIDRLSEVPGIAKKRVKMIQTAWDSQKAIKEVMVFLQGHGVSTTYAVKIFKQYGDEAIETVTHNPYRLATDVYGIGFITADQIARSLGISPHSEYRYRSGLLHVLSESSEEGHCYLPQPQLIDRAVKQLTLPEYHPKPDQVEYLIHAMISDAELIVEQIERETSTELLCYAPPFFRAEFHLSRRLLHLLAHPIKVDKNRVRSWLERFMAQTDVNLSQQQQQAVELAASERVVILTGGPGTGKTFTTRTIVALWKAMGKEIVLASPTGRAAQRLSEVTGHEAKTIHRLLEFDPKTMKFQRDSERTLVADAVVIDEASMLDLFLANSLIKAIGPETQLLLVGDTDQLPSVGPGNVLLDLITAKQIPVMELTEIFRQAQASHIIRNAHRINQGQFPQLESVSPSPMSDCLWLGAPEPEQGVQAIQELINDLIPQLGYVPARDVQVLCPMTRGEVGTRKLNQVLQALINPPHPDKAELTRGGLTLRVGDRVLQQVNDYNREVFNGDMGVIEAINLEEIAVTVQYAERSVSYDLADLNEIGLAWAVTIHKSQGSEYPVVILPMYMQHYIMLSRNLLYTGLTRAKKLAMLVGPKNAISMAVRQIKDRQRYTLLERRLGGVPKANESLASAIL
ncbi:SF1B family DNA helicase RecD2 [Acaryochloris marina]|uniref:ATP-dependent RecD2 DNA helicase n=1 Tax=Acaryochloris marina (strain MBIC 11017) TaxID=329726 RepID=A8ZKA0_ACAM1|nr:ATP-dependent RecD-like DNA helicase [Acaryochloris marina]ABW31600.1 helicase, RecD/TraA family [Acaryochloris marina MBIC11017]